MQDHGRVDPMSGFVSGAVMVDMVESAVGMCGDGG